MASREGGASGEGTIGADGEDAAGDAGEGTSRPIETRTSRGTSAGLASTRW